MSASMDLSSLKAEPSDAVDGVDLRTCTPEAFFRLLSKRLGSHWEPIATYLDVSNDQITVILKGHDEPDEQIFQMLMVWQKKCPSSANAPCQERFRETIAKALWDNGRRDLSEEIMAGKLNPPSDPPQRVPTSARGHVVGHPDEVDEKKLRKLADSLPGDWEPLATELGVPNEDVEKLKKKYRSSKVTEPIFQMLLKWKKNNPGMDHKGILMRALASIGRRDLAEKLQSGTL